MSQQDPLGRRFPHAPSLSQKRHQHYPDDMRDYRGNALEQQPPAAQEQQGWWGPLENIWSAFAATEETQQDLRDRMQRERAEQEQQLQMRTHHDRSHLDDILHEDFHHELVVPHIADDLPPPKSAYPQTWHQRPAQKDGFCKPKQRGVSPVRSRPPTRFRQSSLRAPQSPGPPLPSEKSLKEEIGLWHLFCGTEKRRLNFWTVLSILILGPPIFLGGFYAGHGLESNPRVWVTPHDGNSGSDDSETDTLLRPTLPPYVYDTNIFMTQDEVLEEDESLYLTSTNQGVHLKQESNGNLVLYDLDKTVLWHSGLIRASWTSRTYSTILQGDGNLVTHSMTYNPEERMWSTEVEWSSQSESSFHGEYALMLTPNADGLLIIRFLDGQIMWSTVPVEFEASSTLYPTRSPTKFIVPTRPPVDYPTTDPTRIPTRDPTAQPTDFPTVAPSPRPTMFPWPITVPQSQVYSIESGPMVGHTTHESVMFWALLGRPVPMQLVYWPYMDTGLSSQTLTLVPDTEFNGAAMSTVQGLRTDTTYLYEIRINDEWISRGHFKTSPVPKQPTSFKYLLASCMNIKSDDGGYRKQPVWNAAMAKNIDFAMLPGDTVYLNNNDWTKEGEMIYDRIWYRNMQQRAESHFAHLIKTVPTYGQWDDHDYGKNNAEHRQKGKENSLKAWGHLWPQPYQGSSYGTGNYYSYSWGDVDFFVLDCRWYRNSYNGTLFGEPQLKWLAEELVASTATFKIIVSASDVMEQSMSRDLKTIGKTVSKYSISGVLFNSGDIHRNEYKVQDIENWPYRIHQFTSSGIARVWRRPFAIINVDTNLNDPVVRADFYSADSREHVTSWSNDPDLDCSEIDGDNRRQESRCTQHLRLSDLTP